MLIAAQTYLRFIETNFFQSLFEVCGEGYFIAEKLAIAVQHQLTSNENILRDAVVTPVEVCKIT